jgi:hypothetical protein
MKKAKGDFKDRYGDDAEAVMYATATKMAKKESKDQIKKAFRKTMPSKVTGYYQIIDFWKEHTQMWGKKPEEVKYEIADWMVDELRPDNTPEREELTKRAWAIVDDVIKNNDEDMTFDDMIDKLSTNESGIMYRAGVKKYGKDGMKKIQSAAGKGASAEEIGKIKDKHNKKKKESYSSLEESVGKAITEEEFDQLAEKKDACYHKVKSRYKVWPSAYASGALVQCRKKGAKNWGNKSK